MRLRTTIIMLLVAFALTAYAVLYLPQKPTEVEQQEAERQLLPGIARNDIQKIEIERESDTLLLEKKGENLWLFSAPARALANAQEVESLLGKLTWVDMKAAPFLPENPEMLAEYGLDKPAVKLAVETKDKRIKLFIGSKTEAAQGLYVMREGEPHVLVIGQPLLDAATKPFADYRQKKLLTFSQWSLDRLHYERESWNLQLAKKDTEWHLTRPIADRAEDEKVREALQSLEKLRIEEFLDKPDRKESELGLDPPAGKLEIAERDKEPNVLLLGGLAGEDPKKHYAKRPATGEVFLIAADALAFLEKPAEEFRSRKVLDISEFTVQGLSWKKGRKTAALEKKDGDWKFKDPEKLKTEKDQIEDWIEKANDFKAVAFASDDAKDLSPFGLAQPAVELQVTRKKVEQTDTETWLWGKTAGETVKYFAKRLDTPRIVEIEEKAFEHFAKAPLAWRTKTVLEYLPQNLTGITAESEGQKLVFERSGENDWKLVSPEGDSHDKGAVDSLVGLLSVLRAEAFETDEDADASESTMYLNPYGLDAPTFRYTLTLKPVEEAPGRPASTYQPTEVLALGKKNQDGQIYARFEKDHLVFRIGSWQSTQLERSLLKKLEGEAPAEPQKSNTDVREDAVEDQDDPDEDDSSAGPPPPPVD